MEPTFDAEKANAEIIHQDDNTVVVHTAHEDIDEKASKRIYQGRRKYWIAGSAVAILSLTIGGIILLVMSRRQGSGTASFNAQRLENFQSVVTRVSKASTLLLAETPQSKALNWLAYKDTTIPDQDFDRTQFVQRYAIMVLYFACDGDRWSDFGIQTLDAEGAIETCDWPGDFLACSNDRVVTALDLSLRHLAGNLPDEVGLLTNLVSLELGQNQLEGTLPAKALGQLSHLGTNFSLSRLATVSYYQNRDVGH